MIPYRK